MRRSVYRVTRALNPANIVKLHCDSGVVLFGNTDENDTRITRGLFGDGLDFVGDLGGDVALRDGRLHRHHLHHVASDLDLAAHESLHRSSLIVETKNLTSSCPVGGDNSIGVLELAEFNFHLARRGVHVTLDGSVTKRNISDDLIDTDHCGDLGSLTLVLGADGLGGIHPFIGKKRKCHMSDNSPDFSLWSQRDRTRRNIIEERLVNVHARTRAFG